MSATAPAPRSKTAARLAPVVALLLVAFFVRAHAVLAMPAFNDESLHIRRSEIVWTFENPATSFTAGKLLGYYWLGAFGFHRLDALHGGRLVYALAILIGAAATYRVGRALFGHAVGLLALLFYAVAPYLVFYERMILADQIAAAFGMLAVWAAIRLARNPTRRAGLLSGAFVSLAALAKLTAAPFALVSLVAIWTLGERSPVSPTGARWRDRLARIVPPRYWPALGTAYAFNILTGLPFILFPIFREVQQEPVLLVGTNLFVTSGFHRVIAENIPALGEMLGGFFGAPAVIVAAIAVVWALAVARRRALFLALCVLLPWSIILVLSPNPSNRYWLLGMPPLFVLVAAGLWRGADALARRVGRIPARIGLALLIATWLAGIALPFVWDAWHDPLALHVPEHDRWEYYTNFSSGYGWREAVDAMHALPRSETSGRVPVVSTIVGCHALRLYVPEDGVLNIKCPFFGWEGEHIDNVIADLEGFLAAESVTYLLAEPDAPFVDLARLPVRLALVERFERPFGGVAVDVYHVTSREAG